jgi:tRNA threonylcarbamoyl adenosine modification protein (Sua5/YciO/YrdC/YwlC family)
MAEILNVNPVSPEPERIARAAAVILQGGVVAIPTDTVYGLAADPFNADAVEKVFAAKGRAADAPILLLVDSVTMAVTLAANLPQSFLPLAERFWPGPLTIVVEASPRIPPVVTANSGRIGLRLPDAAIPRALIRELGGPITATSANRSGEPESRRAEDVQASLGTHLSLILDGGPSGARPPSSVVSLSGTSWELIREGAVARAELERFVAAKKKA